MSLITLLICQFSFQQIHSSYVTTDIYMCACVRQDKCNAWEALSSFKEVGHYWKNSVTGSNRKRRWDMQVPRLVSTDVFAISFLILA